MTDLAVLAESLAPCCCADIQRAPWLYGEAHFRACPAYRRAAILSALRSVAAEAAAQARREAIEEAAKVAQTMPSQGLHIYERPGSQPWNAYVPLTGAAVAAAIRARLEEPK